MFTNLTVDMKRERVYETQEPLAYAEVAGTTLWWCASSVHYLDNGPRCRPGVSAYLFPPPVFPPGSTGLANLYVRGPTEVNALTEGKLSRTGHTELGAPTSLVSGWPKLSGAIRMQIAATVRQEV